MILSAAGCTTTAQYRREALASEDPEELVGFLWEYEGTDLEGREVREDQIVSDINRGIEHWPADWRFHAFKAAHFVRAGDIGNAQVEHEQAKRLYELDPYLVDPALGESAWDGKVAGPAEGVGIAVGMTLGGPLGVLGARAVVDAMYDDVAVPYPQVPTAETWFPPTSAYPKSES